MKLLTIIIKDTGLSNHKLLKTIADNYQYYPKLEEKINIYFLTKTPVELPPFINLVLKSEDLQINSKYLMFVNSHDNFGTTLESLCTELEAKDADMIITSLGNDDKRMNELIATENFQDYLTVACNRIVFGTIFKNEFIMDKKINVDLNLRGDGIKLIVDVMKFAPVVDYLKIKYYQIERNKWWIDKENTMELFGEYDKVFRTLSEDLTNPIAPLVLRGMLKRIFRQNLEKINEWKKLKKKHKNTYEYLYKEMSIKDQINFKKPKFKINNLNLVKSSEKLVYQVTKNYDFKQKKIVLVDYNSKYQSEIKYLVKKLHRTPRMKEYRVYCIGKGNNPKINYINKKREIKYHLLTADEIIGFDFKDLITERRKNQEYTQVITTQQQNNEITEEISERLLDVEQNKRNLITTVWIDTKESNHLIKSLIDNVAIINKELPSTRWLKKNQYNTPLYEAIFKKYRLEQHKKYVMYIPQKEEYKIFIDVKMLLSELEQDEELVIYIKDEIDYEIVNFDEMPYYLFCNNENITELMLIMDGIKTTYGNYRNDFEKLNRQIK